MTDYLDRTPSGYKIESSRLWSWGYGQSGALGDGTSGVNKSSPVQVATANTYWKQASAFYHSLAIKADGTLWTWGFNGNGQLGIGSISNVSSPVQIGNNTNWKLVIAGHYGSAAIKTDGTLWVWGNNAYGQLANNTDLTHRSSPVQELTGGTSWKTVGYGRFHVVGIKNDGTLWSWGHNFDGQLGANDQTHRSSPVQEVLANTRWQSVSCGRWFTLATRTDGTLWGWGDNNDGQLGKNDRVHRSSPVQEVSGGTNWKIISAGYYHSAGIKTDGSLWTWGRGGGGRIGNGSTNGRSSPAQTIAEGTDWKAVAAAGWHTAALKTDGTIWTFGENDKGNLGNNDYIAQYYPEQMNTPNIFFKDVTADGETTIGIAEATADVVSGETTYVNEDTYWIWGGNHNGYLGDGTLTHRSSPIILTGSAVNWKVAGGGWWQALGIKTDGTLWLWGGNDSGQVGDNSQTHRSSPVQTALGGTNWKFASGGAYHTVAVKTDGTVWSWGWNADGQLGINSSSAKSSPVQEILANTQWKMVSAGYYFSAAIRTDGTAWLWGKNHNGILCTGDLTHRSSPVQIGSLTTWKDISSGGYAVMGLRTDGTIWSWGKNSDYQLGDATATHRSSPVQEATANTMWKKISSGGFHAGAIRMDGTLWVWGRSSSGQLGTNAVLDCSTPVQTISAGTNWKNIALLDYSSSAIKTDGTLWVWGGNHVGQLGTNDVVHRSSPVQVLGNNTDWTFSGYTAGGAAGGLRRAINIRQNNALVTKEYLMNVYPNLMANFTQAGLWAWGSNRYGDLADGSSTHRSSPVQNISGAPDWKAISAGTYHAAAIKKTGTLWSWGHNQRGQLGDNSVTPKSSPVQEVLAGTTWNMISCGFYHSVALKTDGTIWAWGDNGYGQLGKNDLTHRSSPVQEVLAGTNWKYVTTTGYISAGIKTDGTLWAWGRNNTGQLGNNSITHKSSPTQVVGTGSWKTVACGNYHMIGIKTDDTLWTWGHNDNGQLGDSTVIKKSSPVTITGGGSWKRAAGGRYHTAAIKNDGTLWTWGHSGLGATGLGDNTHRSSPTQILTGGTNWKDIDSQEHTVTALKTDGTLWVWGTNTDGGLGLGDLVHRSSPVQLGTFDNWIAIASYSYGGAALRDDSEDLI